MGHAAANMLPGGVMSAVQLHTLSVDLAASLTDGLTEPTAATPRSWHSVTFPTYAAVRRTLTDTPPTHDGPSSLPRRMLPPDRPCPPRCDETTRLRRRRRPAQRARSALADEVLAQPSLVPPLSSTAAGLSAPKSVPAIPSHFATAPTADAAARLFSNHVQPQQFNSSSIPEDKSLKRFKHRRHRRRHQQHHGERERGHILASSSHSQSHSHSHSYAYSPSHSHSRSSSSSSPSSSSSSSPSPSLSPLSSPATSPASVLHPQQHINHTSDQPQRIFRSSTTSIPLHQQTSSRSQGSATFIKPEHDISPTTTITTTTTTTTGTTISAAATPVSVGAVGGTAASVPTTVGFGPRSEPAARFRSIRPPTPPRRSERARIPSPPRRSHRPRQSAPTQASPVPAPAPVRSGHNGGEWTQAPRSAPEWPRPGYGRSNGDWHRPSEFARTPPSAGDFARPTPVPAEWARAAARAAASAATASSPPPSPGKPVRGASTSSGSASSRLSAVTPNVHSHYTYPHSYTCVPQSYNHPSLSSISNNTNPNNPVVSNNHSNHSPNHNFLSPNRRTPMHSPPLPRPDCYAGPLSKRCARTRRMVRRHFVLSNGALSNFRAPDDVKPSWTASLVGARVTADLRANRVVVAWRYRRLVLAADTIDDARFWAQALTAAADNASAAARRAACAAGPMGAIARGPGGVVGVGAMNYNATGGGGVGGVNGGHDSAHVGATGSIPVNGTGSSGYVPVAAGA